MKKIIAVAAMLGALPLAAFADVTKEDIRKLSAAGVSEDVIANFIRSNGPVAKLSADDVIELKQAGVTDRVLNMLMGAPPVAASAPVAPLKQVPSYVPSYATPAPAVETRTEVIDRTVYVPRTTYVYTTPTYYYPEPYTTYYSSCSPSYPRYYSYSSSYPSYSFSYNRYRGSSCRPRSGWSVGLHW